MLRKFSSLNSRVDRKAVHSNNKSNVPSDNGAHFASKIYFMRMNFSFMVTAIAASLTMLCCADTVAQSMRYRIEPKQVIPYTVTITGETPTSTETLAGIIAFTGSKADSETLTIEYSGGLTKTVKSKASNRGPRGFGPGGFGPGGFGRPGGPPIPRSPFDRPDFGGLTQSTSEMVLTTTGSIKSMRGDSQLPFLLGNLSLMPFELLPSEDVSEWSDGNGLSITSRSSSESRFGPRFGPFATDDKEEVRTGGSESATYRITNTNGDLVTISKTYTLNSPAATADQPGFQINGNGTWTFNRKDGVSQSMDFKSDLTVAVSGSTVKVPVTVKWNRTSTETWEAHLKERQDRIAALQKDAQERRDAAAKAAKEREGRKLESKDKQAILADLNASSWPTISRRLDTLQKFVPHPDDFDIALRIKDLQSHKVLSVSRSAKELWKRLDPIVEAGGGGATTPASESDNPFATDNEKQAMTAARELREWSDSSGSFRVKARFVRIAGENVVLEREDGQEVNVRITRLSEADQKIIAGLK